MMNYYKMKRSDAERYGINLYAHCVSATHAVVSDMDLRRVVGFDKSPEELQQSYGLEPMTDKQIAEIQRDHRWSFYKS